MHAVAARRAPAWGLGWAAGAVPLAAVVVVDPAGWYPFGPAKQTATFVAAFAAIACVAWRAGARATPGVASRRFGGLWLALLGWLALAAAAGDDPLYAWIGTPERRYGWATWALVAGCAWAGSALDGAAVRRLTRLTVLAGVWCGAYCLVELWWRQPIETSAVTSRLGGPFGSAAYLGAALCLLVPVAAATVADRTEPTGWRAAAGVAAVSGAIGLAGSGTRAAWLAIALVAVAVAVVVRPAVRVLVLGLAVVAIAVGVVAPRLDDVAGRADRGASRLAEWQVAARVIAERPLLGAGPEGYRIAFADGVDDDYERTYGREVLPDRAHSGLLDVAAIGGVPAALLYAGVLAIAGWAAWWALRWSSPRMAGLAAAVVAYGLQQLLLFPVAELDPVFWLFAGVLVARGDADVASPSAASSGRGRAAVGVMCGLLAIGVFAAGVLGVAADRSARTALRRPAGSDGAVAAAERAANLRPDVVRHHLLVSAVEADRQSVAGLRAAVTAASRATDVSPGDPVARQRLAAARNQLAQATGSPQDLAAARHDWNELVADDAHCLPCWLGLGTAAILDADAGAARAALERAVELSAPDDRRAAQALAALSAGEGGG